MKAIGSQRLLALLLPMLLAGLALPPMARGEGAEPEPAAAEPTPPPRARSNRDHSIPYYLQRRPVLALQIGGALNSALGADSTVAGESLDSARSFEISGDFQPPWVQAIGVLAFGVHVKHHIASQVSRITGYGAQAGYQAKWFTNQWVVPMVRYSLETLNYKLTSGTTGSLSAPGLTYGALLFLSAADPAAAAEFYNGYGISRAYLAIETGQKSASNASFTLSGRVTSVGLRFEF